VDNGRILKEVHVVSAFLWLNPHFHIDLHMAAIFV